MGVILPPKTACWSLAKMAEVVYGTVSHCETVWPGELLAAAVELFCAIYRLCRQA